MCSYFSPNLLFTSFVDEFEQDVDIINKTIPNILFIRSHLFLVSFRSAKIQNYFDIQRNICYRVWNKIHITMAIERHHDVVGFSSRGNFIYIAMKIYLPHDVFLPDISPNNWQYTIMLDTPYCELIDDRVWNLIHNSFLQPQLLPPYLNAITSLIGSLPKGFGRVPKRVWGTSPMALGRYAVKQRSFTR